ncbi:hypothetical protein GGR56DRAFT_511463 [Xylariaceae sp. FL0804]|nr:hypothetical protein GGR56DRAFT_511463 [Xylariaceae sp. FL0804]
MVLYADNAPALAAAVIIICVFAFISFGLRVYSRLRFASWGMEDTCMAAAMPTFIVLSFACIACAFNGIGATNETLSLPGNEQYREKGLFYFFLFEVFYCINIIPVKASISLILVRIAQGRRPFIMAQWFIIATFSVINLTGGLYIIFQCAPVSAAWTNIGTCNDATILADVYYAVTAVNILTDWTTAFMPIPLLWNVQMNRNAKMSVAFVLGLGFFASLSACIRLKYTVGLTETTNYQYAISNIVIWGYAENGLGVLVGCLATLKPLFRKVLRLGDSSGSRSTLKHYGKGGPSFGKSRRDYTDIEDRYELNSKPTNDHFRTDVTANGTRDAESLASSEEYATNSPGVPKPGVFVSTHIAVTRE